MSKPDSAKHVRGVYWLRAHARATMSDGDDSLDDDVTRLMYADMSAAACSDHPMASVTMSALDDAADESDAEVALSAARATLEVLPTQAAVLIQIRRYAQARGEEGVLEGIVGEDGQMQQATLQARSHAARAVARAQDQVLAHGALGLIPVAVLGLLDVGEQLLRNFTALFERTV